MTQPLDACINQVVAVLRTVSPFTHSNQVPINPTSIQSYSDFVLVYPSTGTFTVNPLGTKKALHNISVDAFTKNMDPARAISTIKPWIDTISTALIQEVSYDSDSNPGGQFGNTIETFVSVDYSFITQADYGGVPVIGYHFTMNEVKILVNL